MCLWYNKPGQYTADTHTSYEQICDMLVCVYDGEGYDDAEQQSVQRGRRS